jgi:tRNA-dihydrouridine synthase B
LKERLTIGETVLEYGLMLAPMAGFSDRAMRLVAKKYGAEYSVSEMVSAKAIVFGDKKTAKLARIEEDEAPAAVQLFGSEPEILAEAAAIVSSGKFGGRLPSAIDINMGCPVPKIFKNGEGSALMKNPSLIEDIVKAVTKKVALPCTVKLRLGIDENNINVLECALRAEAGGASLITIHGRTRAKMYSGNASYEQIKIVKKNLQIPVIANGDITDADTAIRVLEYTGADGIMIGRGAIGNPFIFDEIRSRISGKEYIAPTLTERAETALLQLRLAIEDKGEFYAVREARGQIARYLSSFRGAAALRAAINRAESYEEIAVAMEKALSEN